MGGRFRRAAPFPCLAPAEPRRPTAESSSTELSRDGDHAWARRGVMHGRFWAGGAVPVFGAGGAEAGCYGEEFHRGVAQRRWAGAAEAGRRGRGGGSPRMLPPRCSRRPASWVSSELAIIAQGSSSYSG
ncbi:uncharacterized protein [Triticum aestivum]|uniref:uncharacterized protein isoform X2 n=1 Tax=Triticum aestivum TaxID=4565 RepID=UPI001D012150|nr:uncharacterized protein LOC123139348 isoform X2 [Triticum aestivum]